MPAIRQPYSSDVTDAEWEFCAPYLTLMIESAPQRRYALREVFNALRYFVRAGCPWRLLPHDLPPRAGTGPALAVRWLL
jgi:transposase